MKEEECRPPRGKISRMRAPGTMRTDNHFRRPEQRNLLSDRHVLECQCDESVAIQNWSELVLIKYPAHPGLRARNIDAPVALQRTPCGAARVKAVEHEAAEGSHLPGNVLTAGKR